MKMKRLLRAMLLPSLLAALCIPQASALEYTVDAPSDYLFGKPTSQEVIYQEEDQNVNRSKTAALIAPGFGTPSSYLPGFGEYLTPNLAPGGMDGGLVNSLTNNDYTTLPSVDSSVPPSDSGSGFSMSNIPDGNFSTSGTPGSNFSTSTWTESGTVRYTDVTQDSYYKDGTLGTLHIPAINLTAGIVQGTDSAALAKGIGHFTDTSIWNGNVCLAAHNRGTNAIFGKIHTLDIGDRITLTTKEGSRTYSVTSVEKIGETDNSGTASTVNANLKL